MNDSIPAPMGEFNPVAYCGETSRENIPDRPLSSTAKLAQRWETTDFCCEELSESTLRLLTRQFQAALLACQADVWVELMNVPDRIRNPDGDVFFWRFVSPRKTTA